VTLGAPSLRAEVRRGAGIRIFVSSTFRDMQAERDALVDRVFPELRRRAEQRGVGLREVDLRWGVTAEEAEADEVLPICLAEIDACRPFFIAILGKRYGWIDPKAPALLKDRFARLAPYGDRSITEIEIRHGALNPPDNCEAASALFYVLCDEGPDDAQDPDRRRLELLKREIAHHGFKLQAYSTPQELAAHVLRDLAPLIELHLPPAEELPEVAAQRAFKTLHRVDAPAREDDLRRILRRKWFRRRILLEGPHGSGKSALLVALDRRQAGKHGPSGSIFISLSAAGGDWVNAFRAARGAEPGGPSREHVFRGFGELCRRHRGAIIIDDLDVSVAAPFDSAITWLPEPGPHAWLIVSTRSADLAKTLAGRGFSRLGLAPLAKASRRIMLRRGLAEYGKALSEPLERRIVDQPKTGDPMYLRIILEELRRFGYHETLDSQVERLLRADSAEALLGQVLARLDEADGACRPPPGETLACRALATLLSARQGVSEQTLLEAVADGSGPVPQLQWSPIRLALRAYLLDNKGILSVAAEALRQAAIRRYGLDRARLGAARRRLIETLWPSRSTPLGASELPWLILMEEDWDRARALLNDVEWLEAAWSANTLEIKRFASDAVAAGLRPNPTAHVERFLSGEHGRAKGALAALDVLAAIGDPGSAASLSRSLQAALVGADRRLAIEIEIEALERTGAYKDALDRLLDMRAMIPSDSQPEIRISLTERAAKLGAELNQLDMAEALLREALQQTERLDSPFLLMRVQGDLGQILLRKGSYRAALPLLEAQTRMARRLRDWPLLAAGLGNLGIADRAQGKLDQAEKRLREAAVMFGLSADNAGRARCLCALSQCMLDRQDYDEAGCLLDKAFSLAEKAEAWRLCADIRRQHFHLLDSLGLGDGALAQDYLRRASELARRRG
jgi:tetratricopeptide (TPR) repeat protein